MKFGRVLKNRVDRFDTIKDELIEDDLFLIIDHKETCYSNYSDPCQEIHIRDSLKLIFQLSVITFLMILDNITWPPRRFLKRLFTRPRTLD